MGLISDRTGEGGALEYQEMFYKHVAARTGVAEDMLAGVHHVEMREFLDMMTRQLVLEIHGMVLSSKGGETQEFERSERTVFRYSAPRRPWWISKRRWAKWKCDIVEVPRTLTVKGTVTPEYTYPDCSKVFPKEDRVIRMATMRTPYANWRDHDETKRTFDMSQKKETTDG